jgi:hypothetical protein
VRRGSYISAIMRPSRGHMEVQGGMRATGDRRGIPEEVQGETRATGDRRGIPGSVGRDAGHRGIGAGSQGCNNPGFKSSWPMAKVREPAEPGAEGS